MEAAAAGELRALVVAGVEVEDLPDPTRARAALDEVGFLVSLELRPSEVTARADVVLPVAAVVEKAGTFLNWEGRARPFEAALKPDQMTRRLAPADARVLQMLADAMDVHLGLPDLRTTRAELDRLGAWDGTRASDPVEVAVPLPRPAAGEAVLAGHRLLLDRGRLQEGDEALAAPGTPPTPASRPPRPPRRASRRATCSPSPARPGPPRCRWRSPRCPTGWSGSR